MNSIVRVYVASSALAVALVLTYGCSDTPTGPGADNWFPVIEAHLLVPAYPAGLERVDDPKARYLVELLGLFRAYSDSAAVALTPPITGVHSSSSPTNARSSRVLPCPRSPSKTKS